MDIAKKIRSGYYDSKIAKPKRDEFDRDALGNKEYNEALQIHRQENPRLLNEFRNDLEIVYGTFDLTRETRDKLWAMSGGGKLDSKQDILSVYIDLSKVANMIRTDIEKLVAI